MLSASVVGEENHERLLRDAESVHCIQQTANVVVKASKIRQVILAHFLIGNSTELSILVVVVDVLAHRLRVIFRDRLHAELPGIRFGDFMHQSMHGVISQVKEERLSAMFFEKLNAAIREDVGKIACSETSAASILKQRAEGSAMAVRVRRGLLDFF